MIYGTGGLAYGETSANGNVLNTPLPGASDIVVRAAAGAFTFACATVTPGVPISCYSGSSSRTSVGWAAGAGLEYRVLTNVTLRLEYLHVDLGGQTVRLNSPRPRRALRALKPCELSRIIDRQGSLGFIGGKAKKSRGDRVVTMYGT